MSTTGNAAISIRRCRSLEDFEQCVALQKTVWGFADADLIPRRFFVVAAKIEGQVLGAFDVSERLVGFCLAVPALHGAEVYLHSHMLAVLPESRRSGLGRQLKLEQRRDALARGIRLIEWTFDPLEWQNAVFNLNRLGAIARRYVPNQYGISSSPLHRGLPTDRLVAEWWLDAPGVAALSEENPPPFLPLAVDRIAIPLDIFAETGTNNARSDELQLGLRQQFQTAFQEGLAALHFEVTGNTGSYLLGPWGGPGSGRP